MTRQEQLASLQKRLAEIDQDRPPANWYRREIAYLEALLRAWKKIGT